MAKLEGERAAVRILNEGNAAPGGLLQLHGACFQRLDVQVHSLKFTAPFIFISKYTVYYTN